MPSNAVEPCDEIREILTNELWQLEIKLRDIQAPEKGFVDL
jgi:hypothetical protein